ncbi:MAG: hypothetical protein H3C64_13040 [Candidatus Kuenenia stuttgartiensis]|nr:hypothetical protein [Candidatus Kuenenia stuttgartiensis]
MKAAIILFLGMLSVKSFSQTFSIVKSEYSNANNDNTGWVLSIKADYDTAASKYYWASCYFGELPNMTDSVKLFLIESLLSETNDTSVCGKPVEALSYRYRGRHDRNPMSTRYNLQIEALILINYIAFSSDAVSYSPFPVIYDKRKKKEITTAGKELNAVIKCYNKWFKQIKKNGFGQYSLPMISKKYEWYGSLYQKQRLFDTPPKWEKLYSCPVLIKQED